MKRLFPLFLALSLSLSACGAPTVGDVGASEQFFAMDTIMPVNVLDATGEAAVQAARAEIDRLEQMLSRTREDSVIALLNTHAGDGSALAVEPELGALLRFAQSVSQDLPGCFDITIAPVMDAWGFTREERHVPDPDTLADTLAEIGRTVKTGWLDLGGNITVVGSKPDGADWRVAVKDPQDTERQLGVVSLRDKTLSTSGGYERYFEANGITYHHILDPETGYPADSGLLSVTVVSSDPLLADALSTALFVAGRQAALDYWRSRDDFELILCGSDGVVTVTEGLTFAFRGEEHGYTCETARR